MGLKRKLRLVLIPGGLVFLSYLLAIGMISREELYFQSRSIDVIAARERHEVFILGIRVIGGSKETLLSRMYREVVGAPAACEWRRTSGILRYYDVPEAAEMLARCLHGEGLFATEAKKVVILKFLSLLQRDRVRYAVFYSRDLWQFAVQWQRVKKRQIDVKDLEDLDPEAE
jgi:hypothetical protein